MATAENYIKGLSDKIKEFMIKLLKKCNTRDIKGQIVLRFETLEDHYEGKHKIYWSNGSFNE